MHSPIHTHIRALKATAAVQGARSALPPDPQSPHNAYAYDVSQRSKDVQKESVLQSSPVSPTNLKNILTSCVENLFAAQ